MSTRERPLSRSSMHSGRERPASVASSNARERPASINRDNILATPGLLKGSNARFGGLSAKQLDKISLNLQSATRKSSDASTIASNNAHPARPPSAAGTSHRQSRSNMDDGANEERARPPATRMPRDKGKARAVPELQPVQEASFIATQAFIAAPLNSRIPPPSPRGNILRKSLNKPSGLKETKLQDDLWLEPDAAPDVDSQDDDLLDLEGVSIEMQEAMLVEDLLFVLMGIEGDLIEFDPEYAPEDELDRLSGARFVISPALDPSLRNMTERILPLATHYTAIEAFVSQQSHLQFGLINHALCAAIRDILREYLTLLAQIEHQFNTSPSFTLQRFWYHIHPTLHTLSLIHQLTVELLASPIEPAPSSSSSASRSQLGSDDESDYAGPGAEGLRAVMSEMKKPNGLKHSSSDADLAAVWRSGGPVKGGETLSVIYERLQLHSGDPSAVVLYSTLLLKASQPYMNMLVQWISHGALVDPHEEFMIKETKSISRGLLESDYEDEYWERRYTLRDASSNKQGGNKSAASGYVSSRKLAREKGLGGGAVVPDFLEPWRGKILLAGKYLNVIRECGREVKVPPQVVASDGLVRIDDESFYNRIDTAYTYANRTLLQLLVQDQQLISRLQSIKHQFFLDQGDSFTHFLDLASHELGKKAKNVSITKLQSLLDLAIRNPSSSSSGDPFKEDVKVALMADSLTDLLMRVVSVKGYGPNDGPGDALDAEDMRREEAAGKEERKELLGIDALTLDYHVTFPLSLIISRKTILKYQFIFRHLLRLKHLEQTLTMLWVEQTKTPSWRKQSPYPELERWKNRSIALRTKMLQFVKEMYGFAVSEVLETNWRSLLEKMAKADTVDGLLKDHSDFLDACLNECMLTNSRLLRMQHKIVTTCNMFIGFGNFFSNAITQAMSDLEQVGGDWSEINFSKADSTLQKFEAHFNHNMAIHTDCVSYTASSDSVALLPLVVRLMSLK